MRGQKQGKHFIQTTRKKDLGASLMTRKKKGRKIEEKKKEFELKFLKAFFTMDDIAG